MLGYNPQSTLSVSENIALENKLEAYIEEHEEQAKLFQAITDNSHVTGILLTYLYSF